MRARLSWRLPPYCELEVVVCLPGGIYAFSSYPDKSATGRQIRAQLVTRSFYQLLERHFDRYLHADDERFKLRFASIAIASPIGGARSARVKERHATSFEPVSRPVA